MPKYLCEYCDVFLTHDSQHGRRQHGRGRKHQENVRLYYMNFLKTHIPVGDPQARMFIQNEVGAHTHFEEMFSRPMDSTNNRTTNATNNASGSRFTKSATSTPTPLSNIFKKGSGPFGTSGPYANILPSATPNGVPLLQPSSMPALRAIAPNNNQEGVIVMERAQTHYANPAANSAANVPAPFYVPPSVGHHNPSR